MSELAVRPLLETPSVTVWDVHCKGSCRQESPEEYTSTTRFVFPYRGIFVRHLGRDEAVAEVNQVLFLNAGEGYRISHPVRGGDACLSITVDEQLLHELIPRSLLRKGAKIAFHQQRLRLESRTQALVAALRHSLSNDAEDRLKTESLVLSLARVALSTGFTRRGASEKRRRLADRAKLVLASDPARRWTLSEVGAEVGVSPTYLTQTFAHVEGQPLYRYHLQLRLARALDLLALYDDLTTLSLDLGFSSHSHFSAAFREAYGSSPSEFRQRVAVS